MRLPPTILCLLTLAIFVAAPTVFAFDTLERRLSAWHHANPNAKNWEEIPTNDANELVNAYLADVLAQKKIDWNKTEFYYLQLIAFDPKAVMPNALTLIDRAIVDYGNRERPTYSNMVPHFLQYLIEPMVSSPEGEQAILEHLRKASFDKVMFDAILEKLIPARTRSIALQRAQKEKPAELPRPTTPVPSKFVATPIQARAWRTLQAVKEMGGEAVALPESKEKHTIHSVSWIPDKRWKPYYDAMFAALADPSPDKISAALAFEFTRDFQIRSCVGPDARIHPVNHNRFQFFARIATTPSSAAVYSVISPSPAVHWHPDQNWTATYVEATGISATDLALGQILAGQRGLDWWVVNAPIREVETVLRLFVVKSSRPPHLSYPSMIQAIGHYLKRAEKAPDFAVDYLLEQIDESKPRRTIEDILQSLPKELPERAYPILTTVTTWPYDYAAQMARKRLRNAGQPLPPEDRFPDYLTFRTLRDDYPLRQYPYWYRFEFVRKSGKTHQTRIKTGQFPNYHLPSGDDPFASANADDPFARLDPRLAKPGEIKMLWQNYAMHVELRDPFELVRFTPVDKQNKPTGATAEAEMPSNYHDAIQLRVPAK